jgi:hypothetical protein
MRDDRKLIVSLSLIVPVDESVHKVDVACLGGMIFPTKRAKMMIVAVLCGLVACPNVVPPADVAPGTDLSVDCAVDMLNPVGILGPRDSSTVVSALERRMFTSTDYTSQSESLQVCISAQPFGVWQLGTHLGFLGPRTRWRGLAFQA